MSTLILIADQFKWWYRGRFRIGAQDKTVYAGIIIEAGFLKGYTLTSEWSEPKIIFYFTLRKTGLGVEKKVV